MLQEVKTYQCSVCNEQVVTNTFILNCPFCLNDRCPNCDAPHCDSEEADNSTETLWYVDQDLSEDTKRGAYCGKCGWAGTIKEATNSRKGGIPTVTIPPDQVPVPKGRKHGG